MRSLLITSTVAILISCTIPAQADRVLDPEEVERIRPVIPAAIEFYNEHSDDALPALTSKQVEQVLDGEVVRIRRRPNREVADPPERLTAYRLIPQPRARVWVAALDPDFQASDLLSEKRLGTDDDGASIWHQYLSLPWPLTDRQWVIRVGPRRTLAESTDDLIWEQGWELVEGGEETARTSIATGNLVGITPESAADTIYVPANEGSWVMFRIEDGLTLVGYRVIARVGGSIPDSWITTFGMAQLSQLLDGVAQHAVDVADLYDPDHHTLVGGDGEPIPRF